MLDKAYDAGKFERDIYKKWEDAGVFKPKNTGKGTHINILPPPNANGSLHLGHASGYTIMDIAGRFARMQGKETLLLPGKDHAGILTQTVFEKKLLAETGENRYDLGREEFYKQCYQFCVDSAEIMRSQEKRIGLSADWDREKFTLDPEISKEVLATFVQMYKDGIAYKGNRIINWCPFCQTALSDMEVEHKDSEGEIWELKYPLADGNGEIIVATTRPETMLGDSGVAVHPDDKRYQHLIGKMLKLPLAGREIPVVADDAIDMNFGSGAVKVTPAHDPLDYEIGKRHNLEEIQVIGMDGKMTELAGKDFEGLPVKAARAKVVEKFKEMGLLGEVKKHTKPLSLHDRCGYTIEPLISEQWWLNTDHPKFSLKKEAIKAVKEGKIKIVPEHFEKTFYHWMENLQDWCISRQLWWGHQIPAFYCEECGNMDVTLGEKTEILFLRHGETDLNSQKILQGGRENPSINQKGRTQVEVQIEKIKVFNPDVIIASPLLRAKESAEIISKVLGKDVIIDERLMERDFGDYTNLPFAEVRKKANVAQHQMIHFQDIPNGESFEAISKRLKNLFDDIEAQYKGKKVLLVAHGGVLRVLRHTEKKETIEAALAYSLPNAHIETFTRYTLHTTCSKCGSKNIKQDPDTFDTWFSSGQWAHNTVCTFREDQYFPGDFMVMGRDLIFFWNVRMIMMSLYSKKDVPYKTLYFTGLIQDKHGKKMSKSKGNGIDPLEMADKYGTDALRLSLFIGSSAGNDMRLYEEKIEGFRNFVNKLWNAARFVQMSLDSHQSLVSSRQSETGNTVSQTSDYRLTTSDYSDADKWILSRTNKLITEVTESLENYRYSEAGQKLYDFTWNEFCDWYLELSKGDKQNISVLTEVLKTLLMLLHPFCPFVTEVLWENSRKSEVESPKSGEETLLALTAWPKTNPEWNFPEAEGDISLLVEVITAIRALRAESKVETNKKITGIIVAKGKAKAFFEANAEEIKKLAKFETLEILEKKASNEQSVTQVIPGGIEIHLPLAGMVDLSKEKERLQKELADAEKQLINLDGRLANEKYMSSAPANLVADTKQKRAETAEKIEKLKDQISHLV